MPDGAGPHFRRRAERFAHECDGVPVSGADTAGSPRPERVEMVSSPDQSGGMAPVVASTLAISEPPWDHMVARSVRAPCHRNAAAEPVALA